jgi:DNA-directed RNA polymerase subunit K/omega
MEPRELESLLNKVGGKYKLVTLFQKRMRELQRGLPRLAESDEGNMWEIVSKEIMSSKVDLVMGEEAEQMRKELALREAEENADAEKKGKRGAEPKPAPVDADPKP